MTDLELREVAERYQQMSESELMDIAHKYDGLTEPAKAILRDEFSRRSLQPPIVDEDLSYDRLEQRTLITIRRFRDLPESFVARSVLESAGIACYLQNATMIQMQWGVSNALGGIQLQVAEEDLAAAEEILSQPIPESFPVDSGPDFSQPVCPQCGSLDVIENDSDRKIAAASLMVGGIPMLIGVPAIAMQRKDLWKCNNCGCKWFDDGQPEPDASTPVN